MRNHVINTPKFHREILAIIIWAVTYVWNLIWNCSTIIKYMFGMITASYSIRTNLAWYDFIDPLPWESILPEMISGSFAFRCVLPGMISGSFVINMCRLESLTLYLSYGCLRMCFYTSWQNFANMASPGKMTITARTASKFCARNWSECSHTFFLDLKSWWIPGNIEPWPKCQPEGIKAAKCKIFELILGLGWVRNCAMQIVY